MLTRREWMRQAAGVTAVAAMPGLLDGQGLAQTPSGDVQAISGTGSLKAHAAARGLLTGCAVNANLLREDEGSPCANASDNAKKRLQLVVQKTAPWNGGRQLLHSGVITLRLC